MNIVVNTTPLLDPLTGIGNYIHHLISYFPLLRPQNDYTYYYGLFGKTPPVGSRQIYRMKKMIKRLPLLPVGLRELKCFLSGLHRGRHFDIYFEPNFIPANIRAGRTVTTIHDFSFHFHPEWHPKDRIRFFKKNFYSKIYRSTRIITDSDFIKREAQHILKLPEEVITSISLGVDHDLFKVYEKRVLERSREKIGLPRNFILYVGNVEPRKNLKNLVKAYLELPEMIRNEWKLVLAGMEAWKNADILQLMKRLKREVVYLRYVDARAVAHLYNLASLFVYPSLYEGFGLPPLEAMACACPVIASATASLPEVCGNAAFFVDPENVSSLSEGIYRALSDEPMRRTMSLRGLERAKLYSWRKTAEETLDLFDAVY